MSAYVEAGGAIAPETRATLSMVAETYWGYVIRENPHGRNQETLIEAGLRFLGLILVLAAYGQWLVPASLFSGDPIIMKAGIAFILGVSGVVIYWYASRGLSVDIQVDVSKREVRVAHRNGRGQTRLHSIIPMRRIESAFLKRSKAEGAEASLYLRFRDRSDVLHVASGPEADLVILHRRLSADLRPVSERINQRLAKSVKFRSTRTS